MGFLCFVISFGFNAEQTLMYSFNDVKVLGTCKVIATHSFVYGEIASFDSEWISNIGEWAILECYWISNNYLNIKRWFAVIYKNK